MLSIVIFSGKHWSRAALGWLLFVVAIDGLAEAGAEGHARRLAAHNATVALGVLSAAERARPAGGYQVPKIAVTTLDLASLGPDMFGDTDDADSQR